MTFALSSEDITLAQSAIRLLDQRFGGKARAVLVVIAGAIPTILMILNLIASNISYLPATGVTAQISVGAVALITLLGKFTPFFNAVVAPPAKPDAVLPQLPVPEAPVAPVEAPVALPAPPAPSDPTLPIMIHANPKPLADAIPVE